MNTFPKKISWTEPWDWEVRKERIRQIYRELPPLWRMGVYSLIVFAVFVAVRIFYPEMKESLTWGRIILTSATVFAVFSVLLPALHVLPYIFHITEKGVFFQFGNSASRIDVKDIISLSFETRDGRRYFVIKARDKNGLPRERIALMAKKGVTEEDVQRFLYDVNLAHLYVVPADAGNELQEGSRQDLQDLQN